MTLGIETEVIVACNRSWDNRVEGRKVEVKNGIIKTRTMSLGNMCLLQSIWAHAQMIKRRKGGEKAITDASFISPRPRESKRLTPRVRTIPY